MPFNRLSLIECAERGKAWGYALQWFDPKKLFQLTNWRALGSCVVTASPTCVSNCAVLPGIFIPRYAILSRNVWSACEHKREVISGAVEQLFTLQCSPLIVTYSPDSFLKETSVGSPPHTWPWPGSLFNSGEAAGSVPRAHRDTDNGESFLERGQPQHQCLIQWSPSSVLARRHVYHFGIQR